jgi:hypothetical protein
MVELARAALVCGFLGGIGFAAASMLKLVEITSGYQTNWHSIMEQTTGLFNGIGLAVAISSLARRSALMSDDGERRAATEPLALGFVLLGLTYLNLRKNTAQWIAAKSVPAEMAGISLWVWFDLGYAILAVSLAVLIARHRARPLPVVPESWLGKGQLLYVGLLWWLVAGNFERAIVAFRPERLVTEGVIYLVALGCTALLLLSADAVRAGSFASPPPRASDERMGLAPTIAVGLVAAMLSIAADWAVVRAIYGDRFAGHAGLHVRFGPRATINRPDKP